MTLKLLAFKENCNDSANLIIMQTVSLPDQRLARMYGNQAKEKRRENIFGFILSIKKKTKGKETLSIVSGKAGEKEC